MSIRVNPSFHAEDSAFSLKSPAARIDKERIRHTTESGS